MIEVGATVDAALTQWVNGYAGHHVTLDAVMTYVSSAGVPVMVFYVVLLWWPKAERLAVRHACVSAGAAFLVGQAINQLLILTVHRPRPYDAGLTNLIVERSSDWSFPSDHATASASIAFMFLLLRQGVHGAVLTAFALLVGLSRVFIGTHYVSDVLGGYATALMAALLVRSVYRPGTRLDAAITNIF